MNRYVVAPILAILLSALALAGCGGDNDRSSSEAVGGAPAPAAKSAVRGPEPADQSGQNRAGGGSGGQPAQQIKVDPSARVVAYTATLKVRAKNVDEAAGRAKQIVLAAGGYVENEAAATDDGRSSLTFKVPSDKYAATLDQLTGQLGTKLELRQQADDLTEEVADVDSRVRSAQASLASFRKLLDRAKTIGEVINVEQELEQRQADLEALQARQKRLSERTKYATVTVNLSGPVKATPPTELDEDEGGFLGGLEKGWKAFVAVLSGLMLALGVLLPFLVTAGVLAAGVFYGRRMVLARRPRRAATPPE